MKPPVDLPWMPFYVDDFLTSPWVKAALARQPELVAWYILLLLHQWKHGHVPDDVEERADICLLDVERMRAAWPQLRRRFEKTEDGWVNKRLAEVRAESEVVAQQRAVKASAAARARWDRQRGNTQDAPSMPKQSDRMLEDAHIQEQVHTQELPGVLKLRSEGGSAASRRTRHKASRSYSPEFEQVWQLHPRGSKADAADQYDRALKAGAVTHEKLLKAVQEYVRTEVRADFKGVHLLRFIRDARWDEYLTTNGNGNAHGGDHRGSGAGQAGAGTRSRIAAGQGAFSLEG